METSRHIAVKTSHGNLQERSFIYIGNIFLYFLLFFIIYGNYSMLIDLRSRNGYSKSYRLPTLAPTGDTFKVNIAFQQVKTLELVVKTEQCVVVAFILHQSSASR